MADENGARLTGGLLGRRARLFALGVVGLAVVVVVGLSAAGSTTACSAVEQTPTVAFGVTYTDTNATLSLAHVGGDSLDRSSADRVTVRYDKHVDYPVYCLYRSDHLDYADGRLAPNGTVV